MRTRPGKAWWGVVLVFVHLSLGLGSRAHDVELSSQGPQMVSKRSVVAAGSRQVKLAKLRAKGLATEISQKAKRKAINRKAINQGAQLLAKAELPGIFSAETKMAKTAAAAAAAKQNQLAAIAADAAEKQHAKLEKQHAAASAAELTKLARVQQQNSQTQARHEERALKKELKMIEAGKAQKAAAMKASLTELKKHAEDIKHQKSGAEEKHLKKELREMQKVEAPIVKNMKLNMKANIQAKYLKKKLKKEQMHKQEEEQRTTSEKALKVELLSLQKKDAAKQSQQKLAILKAENSLSHTLHQKFGQQKDLKVLLGGADHPDKQTKTV